METWPAFANPALVPTQRWIACLLSAKAEGRDQFAIRCQVSASIPP
jgi:hypothetical protein